MPALVAAMTFEVGFSYLAGHALVDQGRPVEGEFGVVVHDIFLFRERSGLALGRAAVGEEPFV